MSDSTSTSSHQQSEDDIETDCNDVIKSFEDMGVESVIARGICDYGFRRLTASQRYALPAILRRRDVLVQNGPELEELCTMAIPSLQGIDLSNPQCQALVITSTRCMAVSLRVFIQEIATHMKVTIHACGSIGIREDIAHISKGCQVIIGTPGRTVDMLWRGALRSEYIRSVVFHETDEMLLRGFDDQINDIVSLLPSSKQVIILSSTTPDQVITLTDRVTQNPIRVVRKRSATSLKGVQQFYVDCIRDEWKWVTLSDALAFTHVGQALIFCNTDERVAWLAAKLRASSHTVLTIGGDTERGHLNAILKMFRTTAWRFLVATTVPDDYRLEALQARVVFNFDIPVDKRDYIRRLGRVLGHRTTVMNFFTAEDRTMIRELERFYSTTIPELPENVADLIH